MIDKILFVALFALNAFLADMAHAQDYAVPPQFENAGHFHDGIAPVMQNGLWGFVDVAGRWVVPPQFDSVTAGADRRFGVRARGRWGYVNSAGQLVIPYQYAAAQGFSEGVAAVSEDGRSFFQIDTSGRRLDDDIAFLSISSMQDGLATVQMENGEWTATGKQEAYWFSSVYLDQNERLGMGGTPVDIEEVTPLQEATAFAKADGTYRVLWFERYGIRNFVLPGGGLNIDKTPAFSDARGFSDGLAAVSPDGTLWGFIDRSAHFVIPPQFEAAREFSEGVAPVQLGGRWGYIDRSGRLVFNPLYDRAYSFSEGFATIRQGDLRGFLRHDGAGAISVAFPPQFQDVFSFREGLAPVKVNGFWGYISAPGVAVKALPPIVREAPVASLTP